MGFFFFLRIAKELNTVETILFPLILKDIRTIKILKSAKDIQIFLKCFYLHSIKETMTYSEIRFSARTHTNTRTHAHTYTNLFFPMKYLLIPERSSHNTIL